MGTQSPDELDPTLRAAWSAPEELPAAEAWLTMARSSTARAQYGYMIVRKHLARVGAVKDDHRLPVTWAGFGFDLYVKIDTLSGDGSHCAMLKELLAELVRFSQAYSGEDFTWTLYEMLKPVIEERELLAQIKPLLPPAALERIDELREMLHQEREDDRRRADEGYY